MEATKKIYLIDDDEDDRLLLKQAIETISDDISIREFDSAFDFSLQLEGLSLDSGQPLILLDMNMPKMNGLELLRKLRSDQAYSHLPVVIISTTMNHIIIRETKQLGIEAYLNKPDSVNGLTIIAENILDCHHQYYQ